MMREALASTLHYQHDMELLAVAGDGEEVLRLATELRPDVVVMDLNMPRMNGIDATRRLRASGNDIRVLVLSAHADQSFVKDMLRAGALGYVVKADAPNELVDAIRGVADGELYLSAQIAYLVPEAERPAPGPEVLDVREREVLNLLAQGKKSADIAAQLFLGVGVVEADRLSIMRKLGLHDDAELTRYAIVNGLVVH